MPFVASVFASFSLPLFRWPHTFTERCKHTYSEGKKLRRAAQTTDQVAEREKNKRIENKSKHLNSFYPLHIENKLLTATLKTITLLFSIPTFF